MWAEAEATKVTRRMRTVASFMLMVEVSGYREEEARVGWLRGRWVVGLVWM